MKESPCFDFHTELTYDAFTPIWDAMAHDLDQPFFWHDWHPQTITEALPYFFDSAPDAVTVVASVDGLAVGLCRLSQIMRHRETRQPVRAMFWLYMMPHYRHLTLALGRQLIALVQAMGMTYVSTIIDVEHRRSRYMVRRAGFLPVGLIRCCMMVEGSPRDGMMYGLEVRPCQSIQKS